MANKSLKITADVSEVKKSILSLSKTLGKLDGKRTKLSIFDEKEKSFITDELSKSLEIMNTKFKANKVVISELISEQQKLERGVKAELTIRDKITAALKDQVKLGKQIDSAQGDLKQLGGGGGGSAMFGGIKKFMSKSIIGAGAAVLANGVSLAVQSDKQVRQGIGNRVRAQGLGIKENELVRGSATQLANAGLSSPELIQRRVDTTAQFGLEAGSEQAVTQRSAFERSRGLEGGLMEQLMSVLRPSLGGAGANDAQLALQASTQAAGLKEALGPSLEVMADLLSDINKNGLASTGEMIRLFSGIASEKVRTPEQVATVIRTINDAMKNSSGEANAFFQVAYSQAGIGGGTIGGTRLAVEDGLFAPSAEKLAGRGYGEKLLSEMKSAKLLGGDESSRDRVDATLSQVRQLGGLEEGQKLGEVSLNERNTISTFMNSVFGTKGSQGFDTALAMESRGKGEITEKELKEKLAGFKAQNDPSFENLKEINASLTGNTQILETINQTLKDELGLSLLPATNILIGVQNTALESLQFLAASEAAKISVESAQTATDFALGGLGSSTFEVVESFGDKLSSWTDKLTKLNPFGVFKTNEEREIESRENQAKREEANRKFYSAGRSLSASVGKSAGLTPSTIGTSGPNDVDSITKANTDAVKALTSALMGGPKNPKQGNQTKVSIQNILPDGKITNSTFHR